MSAIAAMQATRRLRDSGARRGSPLGAMPAAGRCSGRWSETRAADNRHHLRASSDAGFRRAADLDHPLPGAGRAGSARDLGRRCPAGGEVARAGARGTRRRSGDCRARCCAGWRLLACFEGEERDRGIVELAGELQMSPSTAAPLRADAARARAARTLPANTPLPARLVRAPAGEVIGAGEVEDRHARRGCDAQRLAGAVVEQPVPV